MNPGERERAVLETLQRLPKDNAVLIGGYSVNAYVPPRFSIDCDLVVLGGAKEIEAALVRDGCVKADEGDVPYGSFLRYEKGKGKAKVSFDLLVGSVEDRQSGVAFAGKVIAKHSKLRTCIGRVTPLRVEVRIVDPELLFAMKLVCGRRSDVRDVFMLAGEKLDWAVVRDLLRQHANPPLLAERAAAIAKSVNARTYKDNLQGPFGVIPTAKFEACKKRLLEFLAELA